MDDDYGLPWCSAHDQATIDRPCWGVLRVFDNIIIDDCDNWNFEACEGHFDGMWIAGDPCDLKRYKRNPYHEQ